jgi:MerR family transcriptional regulator, copper efflux regulator
VSSSYTIGEVASRSGFSASALRYYEGIGLVEPSTRSEGGYRLYDDRTLDRLAFIARAKQLGCTLEEITDLVSIWDGQQCGPVQRRFHDLITAKIRDARARLIEVAAFAAQLQAAAEQLSGEPVDGPCSADCACVASPPDTSTTVRAAPVSLGRKPDTTPVEVPIACTLEPEAMPDRLAEWSTILATATDRVAVEGGIRIEFTPDVDFAELARLVGAEHACCAFFSFSLFVDATGTALEVRAPELAAAMVTELFGSAA